ncbi:MAG TPA: universal stress protein [Actinophytocola sp.]|uniref:universal stress protein n=1 Tax=Actinophytocola sp. TaxID=1872138 RepID=UPI002DB74A38|nr:universal stress protein [Actinophytocola sp.]HEU5470806.1 universal stress protein [Actinophytocola sp.]
MSINDKLRPVVVAVDGSDSAVRAARWAAAEARRRGRVLRVVHADEWPLPTYGPVFVKPKLLQAAVQTAAATVLRDAAAAVGEAEPQVRCETQALSGPAVAVLREVSRHAALLVLGSRGLGGFTGLLVGSVAVALAAHGYCPVVVVRGAEPAADGPVVVGVDGSPTSEAALALAFDEAAARGVDLVAVHAWSDLVYPLYAGAYLPDIDWRPIEEQATELLAERLAGWSEKYPQVRVRRLVERDRPANALLTAAQPAQLLVVGSRGRGGFAGLTLGSVSQAMIHHAPCPVLVARPDAS